MAAKGKVIIKVLNVKTQQLEDFVLTIKSDEYLLTGEDGAFLKFPATLSKKEVLEQVEIHNKVNAGQILMDTNEVERFNEQKLQAFQEE